MEIFIHLPRKVYLELVNHLVPPQFVAEEAAFVYARPEIKDKTVSLHYIQWDGVPPEGFEHRSRFYLELTDETKASVIKRAHDLEASLIEFHSHEATTARFSDSDFSGFREFVPHVMWRLKRRPYAAVVVTRQGFDALAWVSDGSTPEPMKGIVVDGQTIIPSGLSLNAREIHGDRQI